MWMTSGLVNPESNFIKALFCITWLFCVFLFQLLVKYYVGTVKHSVSVHAAWQDYVWGLGGSNGVYFGEWRGGRGPMRWMDLPFYPVSFFFPKFHLLGKNLQNKYRCFLLLKTFLLLLCPLDQKLQNLNSNSF